MCPIYQGCRALTFALATLSCFNPWLYVVLRFQVRIGDTIHPAGCARYANLLDELYYRDLLLERLSTYIAVAVGGGFAIACVIAICTKRS